MEIYGLSLPATQYTAMTRVAISVRMIRDPAYGDAPPVLGVECSGTVSGRTATWGRDSSQSGSSPRPFAHWPR